ncbi:MAG: hypothetical protein JWP36_1787, partial [Paucimonas sp.]|nr:hypothetical protein [Paucimonas sp.]
KVFATADEASRIDALLHLWGGQARTAGIAEAANAFHSLGVKPSENYEHHAGQGAIAQRLSRELAYRLPANREQREQFVEILQSGADYPVMQAQICDLLRGLKAGYAQASQWKPEPVIGAGLEMAGVSAALSLPTLVSNGLVNNEDARNFLETAPFANRMQALQDTWTGGVHESTAVFKAAVAQVHTKTFSVVAHTDDAEFQFKTSVSYAIVHKLEVKYTFQSILDADTGFRYTKRAVALMVTTEAHKQVRLQLSAAERAPADTLPAPLAATRAAFIASSPDKIAPQEAGELFDSVANEYAETTPALAAALTTAANLPPLPIANRAALALAEVPVPTVTATAVMASQAADKSKETEVQARLIEAPKKKRKVARLPQINLPTPSLPTVTLPKPPKLSLPRFSLPKGKIRNPFVVIRNRVSLVRDAAAGASEAAYKKLGVAKLVVAAETVRAGFERAGSDTKKFLVMTKDNMLDGLEWLGTKAAHEMRFSQVGQAIETGIKAVVEVGKAMRGSLANSFRSLFGISK